MLRIGLLGADSFHALAFAKLANLPSEQGGSGLNVCISSICGEGKERTKFVAQQANIPIIVKSPYDMTNIDAVMIVTRSGDHHLEEALPFIEKGIPVWIDKPFTFSLQDAQAIIKHANKNNVFLAGGSFCKYCPDVLKIREQIDKIGGTKNIFGAHFNFPAQASDPYGGFHFYAPHSVEILSTIFGNDIRSIKADETNENLIGIFKYDKFSVSVNFAQVSSFFCTIYGKVEVFTSQIDISDIYRYGFEKIVNGIINSSPPESMSSLIWPVKIVNSLIEAVESGKEVFIDK